MSEHHTMHYPNNADGWKKEITKAWDIIRLDEKQMQSVAADEKSMGPAIAFIVLGSLCVGLGNYIFPQEFFGVMYRPGVATIISSTIFGAIFRVVGIAVVSLIAQHVFKGKAQVAEFLRVAGYAAILSVLSLVPMLTIVAGLWSLVVAFNMLKSVHKLDTGGAIGTMVLAMVAGLIVAFAFSFLFVGAMGSYMMYY